jgi:hypothetical protein
LATGCGGVNEEKTREVLSGETAFYPVDPPTYDQSVKVEIKSDDEPVSALVFKGEDQDKARRAFSEPPSPDVLARQIQQKQFTLEAKVPAKTAYMVAVNNDGRQPTKIHVKITGH